MEAQCKDQKENEPGNTLSLRLLCQAADTSDWQADAYGSIRSVTVLGPDFVSVPPLPPECADCWCVPRSLAPIIR